MEKLPVNSYIENYSKMSECPLKNSYLMVGQTISEG